MGKEQCCCYREEKENEKLHRVSAHSLTSGALRDDQRPLQPAVGKVQRESRQTGPPGVWAKLKCWTGCWHECGWGKWATVLLLSTPVAGCQLSVRSCMGRPRSPQLCPGTQKRAAFLAGDPRVHVGGRMWLWRSLLRPQRWSADMAGPQTG